MAEKSTNKKNVEKVSSTLANTQEKTTKTSSKKVDSKATTKDAKTESTKAKTTSAPKAKAESTKTTSTPKANSESKVARDNSANKTAKSTSAKTENKTATTTKAKETKPYANAKPAEKASNTTKADSKAKSTTKSSSENKSEKQVPAKTAKTTTTSNKSVEKAGKSSVAKPAENVSKQSVSKTSTNNAKEKQPAVATNANDNAKSAKTQTNSKPSTKENKVSTTKAKADQNNTDNLSVAASVVTASSSKKAYEDLKNKQDKKVENNQVKNKKSKDVEITAQKNNKNNNSNNKLSFKERLAAIVASDSNNQSKTDTKNTKSTGSTLTFKDFITNKKLRMYAITAIVLLLIFILILSVSISAVSANKNKLPNTSVYSVKDNSLDKGADYDYEYRTTASVGYNAEVLGTVKRNIPAEMKNEGLDAYPVYGRNFSTSSPSQVIRESSYLSATGTRNAGGGGFNVMDANGYLYTSNGILTSYDVNANSNITKSMNTSGTEQRQLYKHTASVGMYNGNVSDDEPGIKKRVTISPRNLTNHEMYSVTGIYAPAGEVIKIEMSEQDMNATGGIMIHIGQALYNRKANNIWAGKTINRMPIILNTMHVNKNTAILKDGVYTAYVGSFLGGPLYIGNESTTFTATISGGVAYSHFILGYTTPEEFDKNKDSTAPYFDLNVWDNGVLLSGPKNQATRFSYDDLFKVAVFWDKVTSTTTATSNQNIVFLFDPFVAAGAAVAFPGQYSVNCPVGWMSGALNYEALITSGHWGNLHEYHHNFQGYGVGGGGEVTNNAMTLVSYALFTKISAKRGMGSYGASGLTGEGWNTYTCATWALDQVMRISDPDRSPSNGNNGLALYATLLHNFGAENFIEAKRLGGGQSYAVYFQAWEKTTHNNMTYYFNEMLGAGLTDEWLATNSNSSYPMFVPVSSVYQTGRSYSYDDVNQYFDTMRPYVIDYGKEFTIDLSKYTMKDGTYSSGSIVIPNGFTYKIAKISQPENGTISKVSDYIYKFTPNNNLLSGKIYVTLQIIKDDNAFEVRDIDLVLEFEQSHELSGKMFERTTYSYSNDVYMDASEAYNNNYEGYTDKLVGNNINSTQNSNSEVWLNATERTDLSAKHAVLELKGKIYISDVGKYRFMLRGRGSTALYISTDNGKNYDYSAKYTNNSGSNTFPISNGNPTVAGSYVDIELPPDSWIYVKMVLVINSRNNSFIGLGMGKFSAEGGAFGEDDNIGNTEVAETVTITYASGYKENYQFPENTFKPDYFYTKQYKHTYLGEENIVNTSQKVTSFTHKDLSPTQTDIDNMTKWLFNDETGKNQNQFTAYTTGNIQLDNVNNSGNVFTIFAQFNEPVKANKFRMRYKEAVAYRPKDFKLYVSEDNNNWTEVLDITNAGGANYMYTFSFKDREGEGTDNFYTFQYYKLEISDTYHNNRGEKKRLSIADIQFISQVTTGTGVRTGVGDTRIKLYGSWTIEKTVCKFGRTYVGKNNATMEFNFTGTQIILFSTFNFGSDFEVYIDGKKAESLIEPNKNATTSSESFVSKRLSRKEHNVIIKCIGEANFESVVRID